MASCFDRKGTNGVLKGVGTTTAPGFVKKNGRGIWEEGGHVAGRQFANDDIKTKGMDKNTKE